MLPMGTPVAAAKSTSSSSQVTFWFGASPSSLSIQSSFLKDQLIASNSSLPFFHFLRFASSFLCCDDDDDDRNDEDDDGKDDDGDDNDDFLV